jgi:5-carboxyvanillate decarboxylase
MAGAAFGFGAETAMTMMRLIYSGALDAFPRLQIILGHYGEALPFLMQRIDFPYIHAYHRVDIGSTVRLRHKPSDYRRRNVWVSTSGNYLPPHSSARRKLLAWIGSCSVPTIHTSR